MITLADRKSRFVLGKRIARKTAAEVEEGMIALLITRACSEFSVKKGFL